MGTNRMCKCKKIWRILLKKIFFNIMKDGVCQTPSNPDRVKKK